MDYRSAELTLGSRVSRKVANNTYLKRIDEQTIKLLLHKTYILTYRADGSVQYNDGGWRTYVTKDRMNEYGHPGVRIWSDRGIWYMWNGGSEPLAVYQDGVVVRQTDSGLVVEGGAEDPRAEQKKRRAVARYAKRFLDALEKGEVPAPSGGDCWYCCMRVEDGTKTEKQHHGQADPSYMDTPPTLGEVTPTLYPDGDLKVQRNVDHLLSHIGISERPDENEEYFVPSLLQRALEVMGASRSMWWWVGSWWDQEATEEQRQAQRRWSERQRVEKALKRYVLRQLGLVG